MASTSDATLKAEIARLTAQDLTQRHRPFPRSTQVPRDVVIDGVTFESSSRSLVRKGRESRSVISLGQKYNTASSVTKPPPAPTKVPLKSITQPADFSRIAHGHRIPPHRAYKSKVSSRTQPHLPRNRNMTLDNTRRSTQSVHPLNPSGDYNLIVRFRSRQPNKRTRYSNKPCPRFTTTGASRIASDKVLSSMQTNTFRYHGYSGACSRGLTCMYQHDPNKIAICWSFLHGNCPNTAESCNLSHDPIPERTPLCVHFANNGRCTRENCPFPHVRVGQRHGVCRDFAVLGYCSKGLDCQMQHVRECPDFAEKGTCSTKGCKLPHVIRANRNRKVPTATSTTKSGSPLSTLENAATPSVSTAASGSDTSNHTPRSQQVSIEDAQLGDEFISLMFNESEDESDDGDDDGTDAEDNDASDEEEGDSPILEDGPEPGPCS
ncbi:hypothetical protein JVU11DRAFT_6225 [Chiua virens]|nr:hypothetical protein JVU11DRAFT_6225 [Chiua virens]